MRNRLLTGLLAAALAFGNTGCVKKMLLDGQIKSTRIGAGASDTIGDYELARSASQAAMMQFEGMHRLAPDNEDALYLLMRGWAGYGYAFAEDDYLAAQVAGDDDLAEYHKKRTKLAYDRSIAYGLELVGHRDGGFKDAKKNAMTLRKWLEENFKDPEDAETLFWLGSPWLARVNLLKDEPSYVSELFVGVEILEHSRRLDPEYLGWTGTSLLASYHARSPGAEMDEAKKLFDQAIAKTQRKSLGILVAYATRYACNTQDLALYEKTLNEVLNADDPDPNYRLQNTIAKRRAKRALSKAAMEDCGFPAPSASAPSTPPAK